MEGVLILLATFLSIGGFYGGLMLVSDPSGRKLEMPLEWLARTPFVRNYFIPGLFITLMFGVGALIGAIGVLLGSTLGLIISAIVGTALVLWIFLEYMFISSKGWIQFVYLLLGMLIMSLSLYIYVTNY